MKKTVATGLTIFTSILIFIGMFGILTATSCKRERNKNEVENKDQIEEEKDLNFKLYMERSGSMEAYDGDKTNHDFKRAVSDMLNFLPTGDNDTLIYIVNDNVYPYNKGIKDFISQRKFFEETKGIGNAGYTDFQLIFSKILSDLEDGDVAIMFSDMIYSVKGQDNIVAGQLLNEAATMTQTAFKNHGDKEVIVIKFLGDYDGKYYPYDSPNKSVPFRGNRPVYAMIFADKDDMDLLMTSDKYKNFRQFSSLKGYQGMFTFTNKEYDPFYTVLLNGNGINGRYKKQKTGRGESVVHGIEEIKMPKKDALAIPVAVDLSKIPVTEEYKTDINNYDIVSQNDYRIASVKPLEDKNRPEATHVILLETDQNPLKEEIKIRMKNSIPEWIVKSNSEDDRNLGAPAFETTTFGFLPMMQGIYKAVNPSAEQKYLFEIPIDIKK